MQLLTFVSLKKLKVNTIDCFSKACHIVVLPKLPSAPMTVGLFMLHLVFIDFLWMEWMAAAQ